MPLVVTRATWSRGPTCSRRNRVASRFAADRRLAPRWRSSNTRTIVRPTAGRRAEGPGAGRVVAVVAGPSRGRSGPRGRADREVGDRLRAPVLQDLEVLAPQVAHGRPVVPGHDHVDLDELGRRRECRHRRVRARSPRDLRAAGAAADVAGARTSADDQGQPPEASPVPPRRSIARFPGVGRAPERAMVGCGAYQNGRSGSDWIIVSIVARGPRRERSPNARLSAGRPNRSTKTRGGVP